MKPSLRIRLVDLTLFGMLGALTFAAKLVMMGLPNIEPSSLMVMLFAVIFGRKAVYPIYVYVTLEILYFGINTWTICYLYIWLILAIGAWVLRKSREPLAWAMLSGVFGLCFGALCGIVDISSAASPMRWPSGHRVCCSIFTTAWAISSSHCCCLCRFEICWKSCTQNCKDKEE